MGVCLTIVHIGSFDRWAFGGANRCLQTSSYSPRGHGIYGGSRELDAASVQPEGALQCLVCGSSFASRNAMFKHLRKGSCGQGESQPQPMERVALLVGYLGTAYQVRECENELRGRFNFQLDGESNPNYTDSPPLAKNCKCFMDNRAKLRSSGQLFVGSPKTHVSSAIVYELIISKYRSLGASNTSRALRCKLVEISATYSSDL
jgi:hypothetical protein